MVNEEKPTCEAFFEIGDDFGDNSATMRCGEDVGHEPPHKETFGRDDRDGDCVFTWFDLQESVVEAEAEEEKADAYWDSLEHHKWLCKCFDCLWQEKEDRFPTVENNWKDWWIFHFADVGMNVRRWIFSIRFKIGRFKFNWELDWLKQGDMWEKHYKDQVEEITYIFEGEPIQRYSEEEVLVLCAGCTPQHYEIRKRKDVGPTDVIQE